MLFVDAVLELIDIIGDIAGLHIMSQFSKNCGYEQLWVAFIVCMFPAALSSLISQYTTPLQMHTAKYGSCRIETCVLRRAGQHTADDLM